MSERVNTTKQTSSGFKELDFKTGLKDGLPIGLGYLSVAFAFGVQASIVGIPFFMSVLISMTNLTSAGQLAGLQIIATLGSILEMVLTQLVINARYFLMSVSITQKLDKDFTVGQSLLCSAFVTDEIFAVAVSKSQSLNKNYLLGLALLPYLGWTFGTLFGSIAGNILPNTVTSALGIALYAMFVAIIIPPSMTERGVLPAVLIGGAISCILYFVPFFNGLSTGLSVIISAVISALVMAVICPVQTAHEGGEEEWD